MKSRVKAYTLMEVSIAMLLAGVVIMITYTVYTIVVRNYAAYDTKNKALAEQVLLDDLLEKDFRRSNVVLMTDSGLTCQSEKIHTLYTFQPEYIIRKSGVIDTFKVNIQRTVFLFESAEVQLEDQRAPVDELQLDIVFQNTVNSHRYRKQYSAAELLKLNEHALN